MKKVISNVLAVTVALQVVMAPATSFAAEKEFPDVPKIIGHLKQLLI